MHSGMQQSADHAVDNIIIDNYSHGKTSETYERYVFNTRKQKNHETMDDYISALCTLASTCNFCDCLKDSLLRDRIVLGIKNSSTRKRLLKEADLNLEICITLCRAAEATSPSQPVNTKAWTEDTTAVQAGSVSSGDQGPGKEQGFSMNLRRCDQMASPDEVEMSEVDFNAELDDSDDSALQWTTEHQSSGFPWNRTERNKQEPAWSMEEGSPYQPSAVYSTVQPMSDNTSLLSLNTSHTCYLCSAVFVLVSSLELHLASVHGEKLDVVLPGSSTPDRCDAGNCSNTDIDRNVDSHSNRKITTNKVDGNGTGDKHGKKRRQHVCDVCNKGFTLASALKRHKLTHSANKPFMWDASADSFAQACDLKTGKLMQSRRKLFVCDVCSKSFTMAGALRDHRRIHTGERPYKCPHCDKDFKQLGHLQGHVKSVHECSRPHLCDVCGAAFSRTFDLKRHKRRHTGEKPHVCLECGQGFTQSSALKSHRHKPFVCDVCGKSFTVASLLTDHKRIHSGERPYKCPHCDKDFKQLGHLQGHVQSVHEGVKPHLCDVCGAAFSRTFDLARHKRRHTGEKPHVCSDCGQRFAQSGALKSHRLIHSGEKPHVCSDCGKGFIQAGNLAQHRLTHSGQKPHSCPHCPSSFRRPQSLKAHLKKVHQ